MAKKTKALEKRLEQIAMDALAKVREYQGFAQIPEQLKAFQTDPVWSLFGMDNENFLKLRYIGNYYTAIFRKMGDMYEGFVRCIMADTLGLDEEAMSLPYSIEIDGEAQGRTLDAQVILSDLQPRDASRIKNLLAQRVPTFQGSRVGFEVRCCYQIGDSKRIQADATAATYLRKNDYLPVLMIFCTTSLTSPVKRLRQGQRILKC
jgi:hypothetical protein